MANIARKTETNTLEQYRVALENAKNQSDIATGLAELSYDANKIAEGEQLYQQTRASYDLKQQEDGETVEASATFKKEKETLESQYRLHRKKAKAIFRKTPEILAKLGVNGTMPKAHTNWIETIRKFYNTTDQEILQKLETVKVVAEDFTNGIAQIQIVETARAEYLREVGESEDATKQKDAAFAKMDSWMQEFYAIADIALEGQPQLMEALGRKRKS
ncbi:hypothetical protein [Aquimarina sp. 2201CG5-10]|uniref:hypothetical protein n=1 Tax=Aquimarina callyspongiae TaxID=3098150 RepID=UPI002AB54279|nr:hypothetical protein [Aquimarina sp. 2201CG5-10]MDY8137514.1 hypothetical protein [Aquimarina sp. 2201CG5-10]